VFIILGGEFILFAYFQCVTFFL